MPRAKHTDHRPAKHHSKEREDSDSDRDQPKSDAWRCTFCGAKFQQKTSLVRHLAAQHRHGLDGKPLSAEQVARQKSRYAKDRSRASSHHLPASSTSSSVTVSLTDVLATVSTPPAVAAVTQAVTAPAVADAVQAEPAPADTTTQPTDTPPVAAGIVPADTSSSDHAGQVLLSSAAIAPSTSSSTGNVLPSIDAMITHPFMALQEAMEYENISSDSPASSTRGRRAMRIEMFDLDISSADAGSVTTSPARSGRPVSRSSTPLMDEASASSPTRPPADAAPAAQPRAVTPLKLHFTSHDSAPVASTSTVVLGTISVGSSPPVAQASSSAAPPAERSVRRISRVAGSAGEAAHVSTPAKKRKATGKGKALVKRSKRAASPPVAPAADAPLIIERPQCDPSSSSSATSVAPAAAAGSTSAVAPPPPMSSSFVVRCPHLPFSALYHEVRQHPTDTPDALADRLAERYGWTPAERALHAARLYDVQAGATAALLEERMRVPLSRTPEAMERYFRGLDERMTVAYERFINQTDR